jgi:hypothetical protein
LLSRGRPYTDVAVAASASASVQPDGATSYEEFLERADLERASMDGRDSHRRTSLLWLLACLLTGPGYLLLLFAVRGLPGWWWQWLSGLVLFGPGAASAGVLIWQGFRNRRRTRELDRLQREWEERAVRGQARLSRPGPPDDEQAEASRLRARMLVDRAAAGAAAGRRLPATGLMKAGWHLRLAGAAAFYLLLSALLWVDAPGGVVVGGLLLAAAFPVAGFVLAAIAGSRLRTEDLEFKARVRQAQEELVARRNAGQDSWPPR